VALQIPQQRDALFEPLQILGHGAVFASGVEVRRKTAVFPGRDGGRRLFLNPQRPESGEEWEYGTPTQGSESCSRTSVLLRHTPIVRIAWRR